MAGIGALTKPRNTPRRGPCVHEVSVYLKDGFTVYEGGAVCLEADGYAVPASKTTSLVSAGIYVPKVGAVLNQGAATNPSGAGNDGNVRINLQCGLFDMLNGTSTDAVVFSDVGALCYYLDDQTVSRLASGASAAGRIMFLNGDGTVTVGIGLPQGNLD